METALLLLGGNLGDRAAYLAQAIEQLGSLGIIEALSPVYETDPWGVEGQQAYLNQAVALRTGLSPVALLESCLRIEHQLGRVRTQHWGARTIDIDLIGMGNAICNMPSLTLPHPRMAERRFVLVPLCDIAPEWRHPVLGETVRTLLEKCPDALEVRPSNDRQI
jgi:2-amino-4-hydroxy-6-hydroxymethyldihydropteridine diphosphokinase